MARNNWNTVVHTRQGKQNQPVNNQDWPEYWHIEDAEPRADESNSDRAGG